MKDYGRSLSGMIAPVAVLVAVVSADAETFTLELKRLDSLTISEGAPSGTHVLRMVRPQFLSMQPAVFFSDGRILMIPARPSSAASGRPGAS